MSRSQRVLLGTRLTVAACLAATFVIGTRSGAQDGTRTRVSRVDERALLTDLRALSSPRYEGRRTGSRGGIAARGYIRDAFATIGLEPAGSRRYEQPFRIASGGDAANVVGRVPGRDAGARTIVLSAHYDHLGIQRGRIHPGADDNASGVAALLAIARHVRANPLRHTVLFAAFDAEELDLAGAKAFVRTPPVTLKQVALNINMDMVSRSDRREIVVAGAFHAPWIRPVVEEVARRSSVRVVFGHDRPKARASDPDDWTLQSDHGAFHRAGVPFVYFGVEDHADYHKPTDTADKVEAAFYDGVVELVIETMVAFDGALARGSAK